MFQRLALCLLVVFFLDAGRTAHAGALLSAEIVLIGTFQARTQVVANSLSDQIIREDAGTEGMFNMDSFFDVVTEISNTLTYVQPNGAVNHGVYDVSQAISLTPTMLHTSMSQSATTETENGGSPGINLASQLDATFHVHERTWIELDGMTNGSPAPGSPAFSRVLFQESGVNRFHSGIGEFPFQYALEPGKEYSLQARVAGQALFNSTTGASLYLTMSVLPPVITGFDLISTPRDGSASLISYTDPDGQNSRLVYLPDGGIPQNYAIVGNDGVQTGGVEFEVHLVDDGIAVVSTNEDQPQNVTTSFFGFGRCECQEDWDPPVQLQTIEPLDTPEAIRPSRLTTINVGDASLISIDPIISPQDGAWGLPTGSRFGVALVADTEEQALLVWQLGAHGSETTIDNPRRLVLDPEAGFEPSYERVAALHRDHGSKIGWSSSNVTLFDVEDLSDPMNPVILATLESADSSFDPDSLRTKMGLDGQLRVSIQEGNTLHFYKYNGVSLEPEFPPQILPEGAAGFAWWGAEESGLVGSAYQSDNQLFRGRHGEAPDRQMQFGHVDVALNASTPPDSPTSYVSLDRSAAVTIDASYVPRARADVIEVVAARDAFLFLLDGVELGQTANAIGNRAAVLATADMTGALLSRGQELARVFSFLNPNLLNPNIMTPSYADAAIETVNPAAMARLQDSFGTGSVGGMIDALVVSDSLQGDMQQAVVSPSFFGDDSGLADTTEALTAALLGMEEEEEMTPMLRTNIPSGNSEVAAVVTPDSYLIASNVLDTPAAEQLTEAAGVLGDGGDNVNLLAWHQLSLTADLENPIVSAEMTFSLEGQAADGLGFFWESFDILGDAGDLQQGDAGDPQKGDVGDPQKGDLGDLIQMEIQLGTSELSIKRNISYATLEEAKEQLDGKFYLLPNPVMDDVLIANLRFELNAQDGEIAHFASTAGLFQLLPELPVDFSGDGVVDVADIDALVTEIVRGSGDSLFDLTGDGLVNQDDLDQWLADAAAANGFGEPYLHGDTNLDGTVNVVDLNNLALNWRQPGTWSDGNFIASASVDTGDLNHLALNWNKSIAMAATAVPEPAAACLAIWLLALTLVHRRRRAKAAAIG